MPYSPAMPELATNSEPSRENVMLFTLPGSSPVVANDFLRRRVDKFDAAIRAEGQPLAIGRQGEAGEIGAHAGRRGDRRAFSIRARGIAAPSGPAAPASIHARSSSISSSVGRGLSSGGIAGSISPVSARIIRLASARPGTTTAPFSPPFCISANDSSDSSPSRSVPLWQPAQYLAKIGAISRAKSGGAASAR